MPGNTRSVSVITESTICSKLLLHRAGSWPYAGADAAEIEGGRIVRLWVLLNPPA